MATAEAVSQLVVTVILTFIAICAVGLRFLSRKLKELPLKADDYTVLLALVSSLDLFESYANCEYL